MLACALSTGICAEAQERHYSIHRNGQRVGQLRFLVVPQAGGVYLRLYSEVRTRILVSLHMVAREEALFRQNVLVSSSIRRYLNGKEKENQLITANGEEYRISNGGNTSVMRHAAISYSTLSLYAWEPVQTAAVFSDAHRTMVPIQKTGPSRYKVDFPDGRSSEFWYTGGTCTKVVLDSPWYSAEIRLEPAAAIPKKQP